MKRILTLVLLVFLAVGLKAQQSENKEYLLFEFMKVQPGNWGDYYSVEEFWSGIHRITSYNVCYTKLLRSMS